MDSAWQASWQVAADTWQSNPRLMEIYYLFSIGIMRGNPMQCVNHYFILLRSNLLVLKRR